jgi:hypothetical protein
MLLKPSAIAASFIYTGAERRTAGVSPCGHSQSQSKLFGLFFFLSAQQLSVLFHSGAERRTTGVSPSGHS